MPFVDAHVVDKLDQMLGSYGPHPKGEAYSKTFPEETSPSGWSSFFPPQCSGLIFYRQGCLHGREHMS
jgi:hypothetical protein